MRKISLTGSLYRLIYCSRSAIVPIMHGPEPSVEKAIRAIVTTGREHNRREKITSALLFTGAGFTQALEGQREVVERTFERICADPRHTDVTVLTFTPTERRSFPDWPLGFCGQPLLAPSDPLAPILSDATNTGPRATTGSDVLRLLERLVQHEDAWIPA